MVTFSVDTAEPEAAVTALKAALGSAGRLTAALANGAAVHIAANSLHVVPPAADA